MPEQTLQSIAFPTLSDAQIREFEAGTGAVSRSFRDGVVLTQELQAKATLPEAFDAFMQRRYDRCRFIVEGSEAIGAWEQDHSLPIDPSAKRFEVTMAAMAPL